MRKWGSHLALLLSSKSVCTKGDEPDWCGSDMSTPQAISRLTGVIRPHQVYGVSYRGANCAAPHDILTYQLNNRFKTNHIGLSFTCTWGEANVAATAVSLITKSRINNCIEAAADLIVNISMLTPIKWLNYYAKLFCVCVFRGGCYNKFLDSCKTQEVLARLSVLSIRHTWPLISANDHIRVNGDESS